jgi:cytochrome c551/c552
VNYLAFQKGCVDCRAVSFILGVYEDIDDAYAEVAAANEKRAKRCFQQVAQVFVLPAATAKIAHA